MKEIIRNILNKAYDERDLELAEAASGLMGELSGTYNCPSNWRSILDELYEEYKDNEWIIEAVFEFGIMASDEEE